jgi:hypothetical protein
LYGDDYSEDEGTSERATEMENILGNALAMTERSNGSIHSLQRSGTNSAMEIGRRIARTHSRENMAISSAHMTNNDSFSYISRTSSFDSTQSLPSFVKVDRQNSFIRPQRSWDNYMDNDDGQHSGYSSSSQRSLVNSYNAPRTDGPHRSWNKLRREFEEHEGNGNRRTRSLGRKASALRKKLLGDSHSNKSSSETRKKRSSSRYSNNQNPKGGRGYAKDYDVEVSLDSRKKLWNTSFIRGKKNKKAATPSKEGTNDSFDTPTTAESAEQQKRNVVVNMHEMHKGDQLFQALEVACCHSITDGDTLDMITDMVPPHI